MVNVLKQICKTSLKRLCAFPSPKSYTCYVCMCISLVLYYTMYTYVGIYKCVYILLYCVLLLLQLLLLVCICDVTCVELRWGCCHSNVLSESDRFSSRLAWRPDPFWCDRYIRCSLTYLHTYTYTCMYKYICTPTHTSHKYILKRRLCACMCVCIYV